MLAQRAVNTSWFVVVFSAGPAVVPTKLAVAPALRTRAALVSSDVAPAAIVTE